MKLTKQQLKQIIKEELGALMSENPMDEPAGAPSALDLELEETIRVFDELEEWGQDAWSGGVPDFRREEWDGLIAKIIRLEVELGVPEEQSRFPHLR